MANNNDWTAAFSTPSTDTSTRQAELEEEIKKTTEFGKQAAAHLQVCTQELNDLKAGKTPAKTVELRFAAAPAPAKTPVAAKQSSTPEAKSGFLGWLGRLSSKLATPQWGVGFIGGLIGLFIIIVSIVALNALHVPTDGGLVFLAGVIFVLLGVAVGFFIGLGKANASRMRLEKAND